MCAFCVTAVQSLQNVLIQKILRKAVAHEIMIEAEHGLCFLRDRIDIM